MLNVQDQSGVTVVEIEHGPVNAFDLELCQGLRSALEAASGPVVITGAGRAFSAGVDLKRIVEGGEPYGRAFLDGLAEAFLAVFGHPAPTVAAVNGHAVAGGCVLALACDARLMAQGKIGLSEVAVGVTFPPSALEIVRYALGPATGRVVLGADLLDTAEAARLGMVDDVVEADRLVEEAVGLARRLGQRPAAAYRATKEALHAPVLEAVARGDQGAVAAHWTSAETQQLLADQLAALSKRS